jgi:hypothetical protein
LNFAPRFEEAAENATALAEVEDVAEIIDAESVVAVGVLSPASKRVLASDVVALIAALLTFSACLFEGGYVQAGAAATAYAAIFVRIYWRLAGKLD